MTTIYRPSLFGRDIMNDWFASLEKDWECAIKNSTTGYPVLDVLSDSDGNTVLEFALAGFRKEEIKIETRPEKRTITISAETIPAGETNRRIARRAFTKSFVNPDNSLDFTNVSAKFENGLLSIKIPKRHEDKPLTVEIQ